MTLQFVVFTTRNLKQIHKSCFYLLNNRLPMEMETCCYQILTNRFYFDDEWVEPKSIFVNVTEIMLLNLTGVQFIPSVFDFVRFI